MLLPFVRRRLKRSRRTWSRDWVEVEPLPVLKVGGFGEFLFASRLSTVLRDEQPIDICEHRLGSEPREEHRAMLVDPN